MRDSQGFDLWADGYDRDVGLSEQANTYPFAGYREVLGAIYRAIRQRGACRVLDLGCGTATLTSKLYAAGCVVTAVDFSPKMLEIAADKMPGAHLLRWDLTRGFPQPLQAERFDAMVSTYALHHLADSQKEAFVREALECLAPGGCLYIGDVAFETRQGLEACRRATGEGWDEEEHYFVAEDWLDKPGLGARFEPFSHCAGVLTLWKE